MSGERPGSEYSAQDKVLRALENIRTIGVNTAESDGVEQVALTEVNESESTPSPQVDAEETQFFDVDAVQSQEEALPEISSEVPVTATANGQEMTEEADRALTTWLAGGKRPGEASVVVQSASDRGSAQNEEIPSEEAKEVYDENPVPGFSEGGGSGSGNGEETRGGENSGGGRRGRRVAAAVALVVVALAGLGAKELTGNDGAEQEAKASLSLNNDDQISQPETPKKHKKHHKKNNHKNKNQDKQTPNAESTQEPTPEATQEPAPEPEPTKEPEPKHTPPPPPPPTPLELVHKIPLKQKLGMLTQFYVSDIDGMLPAYQAPGGESQLNDFKSGLIGGLYIASQPLSNIGLVGSVSKEVSTNGILPADAVYSDATLGEKKVESYKDFKQIPSISALIEHGMSLDDAMELYKQHYEYLKKQGVESVNISGKLPEKYVTVTRKRVVKWVGPKGHKHKRVRHKRVRHEHPIDPLVAAQYVKERVQAAEESGLDTVVGSFEGTNSEDDSKGFVFAQKAGADIRVSSGLADSKTALPPSIDAVTYSTLDSLDNKTITYTGVFSETNFESSDSSNSKYGPMPMAKAAVGAMVAGADRVTVRLPEDDNTKDDKTPVSEWLKDFKSVARQAIKSGDLTVKEIDKLVLEKLQQENISPKNALNKLHNN